MIQHIFIMLGDACNISCRYCMQHPLVTKRLGRKISNRVYQFINRAIAINGGPCITLYGGEPLLYLPAIKEIVLRYPSLDFGIISNCKALSQDVVDFCNEHDICIALSYDGYNVMKTRGYNAVKEKLPLLLQLKRFCLTGVMTPYSYPLDLLDAFEDVDKLYFAKHNKHIGVNIDLVRDTGWHIKDLLEFDYDKLECQLRLLATEYLGHIYKNTDAPYTHIAYMQRIVDQLYNSDAGKMSKGVFCGNGTTVMNIDLDGNLYPCHNTTTSIGDIDTPAMEYMAALDKFDTTPERRQKVCRDCKVLPMCRGGCMLVNDLSYYCKLRKAYYGTIMDALESYAKEHANDISSTDS